MRVDGMAFAVALLLTGCYQRSAGPDPDQQLASLERWRDAALIYPSCESTSRPPESQCGLIAERYQTHEFVQRFVATSCSDGTAEDCRARYEASFARALANRYSETTAEDVARACGDAEGCGNHGLLELHWMKLHDLAVWSHFTERQTELLGAKQENQRRAEQRSRDASILGAALLGASRAGQPASPPSVATGCTSDFECAYGQQCLKGSGDMRGSCARVVNETGVPQIVPPSGESVEPGREGNCSFTTDCPVGFRCEKAAGKLTGFCLR